MAFNGVTETIPWKVFMNSDVGLFVAGGVVLIGLIIAEKFGVSINETLVLIIAYTSIGASLLMFILKTTLWHTLFM
ncbi:MAG: hypothetical protein K0R18_596 [Bacillales bacterium]|nr:hypothetical protein [Bacillales bacterium]